jgi:hypothetical protein
MPAEMAGQNLSATAKRRKLEDSTFLKMVEARLQLSTET